MLYQTAIMANKPTTINFPVKKLASQKDLLLEGRFLV